MLDLLSSDLRFCPRERKNYEMFTNCLKKGIKFSCKLSHSFKFRFKKWVLEWKIWITWRWHPEWIYAFPAPLPLASIAASRGGSFSNAILSRKFGAGGWWQNTLTDRKQPRQGARNSRGEGAGGSHVRFTIPDPEVLCWVAFWQIPERSGMSPSFPSSSFSFFSIFCWLCYYSCPISSHLIPSALRTLPTHIPPP